MLLSLKSLKELSAQIKHEFNFKQEAEVMNRMQLSLKNHVREGELITVPSSIMATKKLLVRAL
jgi:predicted unusual protein kinase regulating ubiquinone biosynthesis (AarF/ABC1/UbiB family)